MSHSLESLMRDSALEAPQPSIVLQIGSFIVIGGGAALCFAALSTAVIGAHLGLPDWVASALCYAIFIVPVYLLHRRFSFASVAPHRQALPRYVSVQLSALALASLFSFVAYRAFSLPTPVAALLVIGLTSGVNFLILRAWAFAHRS